jgi:hypothetical protein
MRVRMFSVVEKEKKERNMDRSLGIPGQGRTKEESYSPHLLACFDDVSLHETKTWLVVGRGDSTRRAKSNFYSLK